MDPICGSAWDQFMIPVRKDLIQVEVVAVPQILAGRQNVLVDCLNILVVVILKALRDLGLLHIDDRADIDDSIRLKCMELPDGFFKGRLELVPWIEAEVIGAKHQVDPLILPAAQSLVDRYIAVRRRYDLLVHVVDGEADAGQEGTLCDAGSIPEAFHSRVSDENGV